MLLQKNELICDIKSDAFNEGLIYPCFENNGSHTHTMNGH